MSKSLPWFKCDPTAFLEGLFGLSREERGSYATILLLIYKRGGPVDDDADWIAQYLGCSRKEWMKDRRTLIRRGKLFEIVLNGEPCLMNRKAAETLEEQQAWRKGLGSNKPDHAKESLDNAAVTSKKPPSAPRKNNVIAITRLEPSTNLDATRSGKIEEEDNNPLQKGGLLSSGRQEEKERSAWLDAQARAEVALSLCGNPDRSSEIAEFLDVCRERLGLPAEEAA